MEMKDCLYNYLRSIEPFVIALSGGMDSLTLMAAAANAHVRAAAVCVETGLALPEEIVRGERCARDQNIPFILLRQDMLSLDEIRNNTDMRCYACKKAMMAAIKQWAFEEGYDTVADGTNIDDDPSKRPGMRACRELFVVHPFAECRMGKKEILSLAAELGVPRPPSSSCLATRIPRDMQVSEELIQKIGRAEEALRDVVRGRLRVRIRGEAAVIEAEDSEEELKKWLEEHTLPGFSEIYIGGAKI